MSKKKPNVCVKTNKGKIVCGEAVSEATFTADQLHKHWSDGKSITFRNKKYRVGKMSYGDYFLEPGRPRGEATPFHPGTIWLEKTKDTYIYQIEK